MIHGPCAPQNQKSPCMHRSQFSRYFSHKKLWKKPSIDVDGYPVYKRRDDGRVIKKGDLVIDNRFVVLFNKYLLMRYNAHITIEWCN